MYINKIFNFSTKNKINKKISLIQEKLDKHFWEGVCEFKQQENFSKFEYVYKTANWEITTIIKNFPLAYIKINNINFNEEAKTKEINSNLFTKSFSHWLNNKTFTNIQMDLVVWKTISFENLKIETEQKDTIKLNGNFLSKEETANLFREIDIVNWRSYVNDLFSHFIFTQNKEGNIEIHIFSKDFINKLQHKSITINKQDKVFFLEGKIFVQKEDWTITGLNIAWDFYIFPEKFKIINMITSFGGEISIFSNWKQHTFVYLEWKLKRKEEITTIQQIVLLLSNSFTEGSSLYWMKSHKALEEISFNKNNIKDFLMQNQFLKSFYLYWIMFSQLNTKIDNFSISSFFIFKKEKDNLEFLDGVFVPLSKMGNRTLLLKIALKETTWWNMITYSIVENTGKKLTFLGDVLTFNMDDGFPTFQYIEEKLMSLILITSWDWKINKTFVYKNNNLQEVSTPDNISCSLKYFWRIYFFSETQKRCFQFNFKTLSWKEIDAEVGFKNMLSCGKNNLVYVWEKSLPFCNISLTDKTPCFDIGIYLQNFNVLSIINTKNYHIIKENKNISFFQWSTFFDTAELSWILFPICLLVEYIKGCRKSWMIINGKKQKGESKKYISNKFWKKIS